MSVDRKRGLVGDFTEFADQAWPQLVRGAVLMGARQHDAEDAVQSVLSRCYWRWRKIGHMADSPTAYAFRALRNELSRSSLGRDVPTDPQELTALREFGTASSENLAEVDPVPLRTAIRGLPQRQREVIVCAFYLELTDRETAAALEIPIGTVKSRKARALDALALLLEIADQTSADPSRCRSK